jgi:hypothetical protein
MAGRMLPMLWLVLAFCSCAFAQGSQQDEPEIEKAKALKRAKLIAAIEEDTSQLRLPENRAFINSKIAAILWSTDEGRARSLFRTAVTDLIAAQNAAEASKNRGIYYDLLQSQSLRPQIINAIATHDPQLALDSLRRSRPSAVERALAEPAPDAKIGTSGNNSHLAQQEINLEQRLIRLASERNPERAVAMLRDSVRKKLSSETLATLQRLYQLDPTAANELARDVVARIASSDFFKNNNLNYDLLNLSNSIISEFLRERRPDEKALTFEESGVRRLAEKVIGTYLEHAVKIGWIPVDQLEPAVKRFSPASYEPLKNAAASTGYRSHMVGQYDPEYKKLMDSNPTADVLVASAKRFEPALRQIIYQNAATKYGESGQFEAARALLNDTLEDELLEGTLNNLNSQYANHLVQKGRYDEAEAVMMELNEDSRVNGFINLSMAIINSSEADRPRAARLLSRARASLPARPENSSEMSRIMSVIGAMAIVDPAEAANMIEPLIEQLNQLTEAFAVVLPFQNSNGARDGEFILVNGPQIGVQIDQNIFRSIAMKAPERAEGLVNGFSRRELRLITKLGLLEALQ